MSNKCRKCGNDMPEDRKGYEQVCPSCKPLLLHNVIGGLEEMEYVNNTYDGPISIGHNQLYNREVEIDDEIINIYPDLVEKSFPKGKCKERGHALVLVADIHLAFIKALSQGKVIKVKE